MKKIECLISSEKMKIIDELCLQEGYTRAELNRRAIDGFLNKQDVFFGTNQAYFFQCPDCKADISLIKDNGKPPQINFHKHN